MFLSGEIGASIQSGTAVTTGFAQPIQVATLAGNPVVLNCTLDDKISINDVWWKYNDRIFLSAADVQNYDPCYFKLRWVVEDKTVQLIIPEASPLNSGTYECGAALPQDGSHGKYDWHSMGDKVLVHVIGEQLELADTECNVIGLKVVNVRWKPASAFKSPAQYSVYFCKDPGTILFGKKEGYDFGCSKVVDEGSNPSNQYLQCDLGGPLELQSIQELFSYYIKANSSGTVYWSRKKTCRIAMKIQCTKPTEVMAEITDSVKVTLRWSIPQFMGDSVASLCYRIFYSAEGDLKNKSRGPVCNHMYASFSDLESYTRYKFYIQCSMEINNSASWGALAGPVEIVTWEEAPSEAPKFDRWTNPVEYAYGNLRNVTVVWKLPPKRSWNGVISRFNVEFWELERNPANKTAAPPITRVVIEEGAATSGVLCGLKRFADYIYQVQMCTKPGCGPWSEEKHILPEIAELTSQPDISTTSSISVLLRLRRNWIIVVSIAVIVVAVLGLLACLACRWSSRRRRMRNRQRGSEPLRALSVSTQSTMPPSQSQESFEEQVYDQILPLDNREEPVAV